MVEGMFQRRRDKAEEANERALELHRVKLVRRYQVDIESLQSTSIQALRRFKNI